MSMIKEAADRMVSKGQLTKKEYGLLEKKGMFKEGFIMPHLVGAMGRVLKGTGEAAKATAKFLKPHDTADMINHYVPTLALLGGVGITTKQMVIDPLIQKHKVDKSFSLMQAKVPQLMDKDPQQIRDYFDVVKTFSPKSASNPLVAGALVNKMMEFGGVDHKLVQDLNNIEGSDRGESMLDKMVQTAMSAVTKPRHMGEEGGRTIHHYHTK